MQAFASSVAVWALPAIVIVTALGALLMCLLVVRYGLTALTEAAQAPTPAVETSGVLAVRLGHAAAGVCFAVAAMLAIVALVHHSRPAESTVSREAAMAAEWSAELGRLREDVRALESRLTHAETLAGSAESQAAVTQSRADAGERRVVAIEARVKAVESSARQAAADAERALASSRQLERTIAARRASPPHEPRATEARPAPMTPVPPVQRGAEARPAPIPTPTPALPPAEARSAAASTPTPALRTTDPRRAVTPTATPVPRPAEPRSAVSPMATPAHSTTAVPAPKPGAAASPATVTEASPRPTVPAQPAPELKPPTPDRNAGVQAAGAPRARAPEPAESAAGKTGGKLEEDWEAMKRDARATGDQLSSALRRLREWVTSH